MRLLSSCYYWMPIQLLVVDIPTDLVVIICRCLYVLILSLVSLIFDAQKLKIKVLTVTL